MYITLLNIGIVSVLVVLSVFLSNIAGILTSLGLGGTNAAVKGSNWSEAIKGYLKDKGRFQLTVSRVEHEYALCDPVDDHRLRQIADTVEKYYETLEVASE